MFKTGISSGREEFAHDILKGFVSVKSGFLSNKQEYLDLSNIHISKDEKKRGTRKTFEQ